MNSSLSFEESSDIPPVPHHPNELFKFPMRSFGKAKIVERSFQPTWFVKWPFLHYDEVADHVFCHTCMKAFKEKKMKSTKKADPAFVINGYCNWKDATVGFRNHEVSGCHREAVEVIITLPSTTMNIGAQYIKEKELNRKMLIKILSCIQFLARQGLPLRGHGDDSDGNLLQLLKYQGGDEIKDWLQR